MSRRDWFRKTSWTLEDRQDFFAHLNRSRRRNRGQYLRIQAVHLQKVGTPEALEAALELLALMLSEYPDPSQLAPAYQQKAECLDKLDRVQEAEHAFEDALRMMREKTNVRTTAHLGYAMFVIRRKLSHSYDKAMEVLDEFTDSTGQLFSTIRYRYCAAKAIILSRLGDQVNARMYALLALEASEQRDSGFRYHPSFGLVRQPEADIHQELVWMVNS